MKRKRFITILLLLSLMLQLTGCAEKAPELIIPQAPDIAWYTVDTGLVQAYEIYDAEVVPTTSEVYFETEGKVAKINAVLGTEVKSGDTIIELNEGLDKEIEELKEELSQYDKISNYYISEHTNELNAMNQKLKTLTGFDRDNYAVDIKEATINFKLEEDNRAAEYIKMQAELEEDQAAIGKSSLAAPTDGIVAYIGADSAGSEIKENDLALVISDESKLYIRTDYMSDEELDKIVKTVIKTGGNEYENPETIRYSEEEVTTAKAFKTPLYTRYKIPENAEIELGAYVAVIMYTVYKENAVRVPNETIFYDKVSGKYYVQKRGEGDKTENVYVEKVSEGDIFTEVSGISVGEQIYYDEDRTLWGREYETEEAVLGNYTLNTGFYAQRGYYSMELLKGGVKGTVAQVFINKTYDVYVEEGEVLYSVKPEITDIDIQTAKLDYNTAVNDRKTKIKNYETQIEEKKAEINSASDDITKALAEYELKKLNDGYDDFVADLDEKVEEKKLIYESYESWSGQEEVEVKSPATGMLFTFTAFIVGTELEMDTLVGQIFSMPDSDLIINDSMTSGDGKKNTSGIVRYGSNVSVVSSSDLGSFNENIKAYSTESVSGQAYNGSVKLRVTDPDMYKYITSDNVQAYYNVKYLENVIILDLDYIITEDKDCYVLLKYGDSVIKRKVYVDTLNVSESYVWVTKGLENGDVCCKQKD